MLETKTGESIVAVKSEENSAAVTLIGMNGVPMIIPRSNIQSMTPQPWSFMPQGLEQGLQPQQMADLLEYVMTAGR